MVDAWTLDWRVLSLLYELLLKVLGILVHCSFTSPILTQSSAKNSKYACLYDLLPIVLSILI